MGKRRTFVKNALVLTAATLLLRLLGMAFRIVISNRLGAEGMGLYQIVLSVYMLASTLAGAGLSIAVTRLVSEEQICSGQAALRRMMQICLGVSAALGTLVGLGLYGAAGVLAAKWVGEAGAELSLRVLSLSMPFMAVSASLRGYFAARRRVGFSSLSQLLEQGVKFGACMALTAAFGMTDAVFGCFLVMAADTLSEIFSFIFQYAGYRHDVRRLPVRGKEPPPCSGVMRRLAAVAAPVAGVRIIGSTLYAVENTLVPALLEKYLSGPPAAGLPARLAGAEGPLSAAAAHSLALAQWGQLKGMAIPVLMFPSTLLASFALLLVPELSEYKARREERQAARLIGLSLHTTLAGAIGIAAGMYLLAGDISELMYPGQEVGFYVRVLAPLIPFMYLENVAEGMLKGLGEQNTTLLYSLVNVAVRLALILPLVPRCGIRGFLWMMLADNVVTSLLHVSRVLQVVRLRMAWLRWVLLPLVCAVFCSLPVPAARTALTAAGWPRPAVLAVLGAGMAAVYIILLLCTGSFTREELQSLTKSSPKTQKLQKQLQKTAFRTGKMKFDVL